MLKQTPDFNKEIISVKNFSEKLTEDVKKNVVRLTLGDEKAASGFFCKIILKNNIIPVLITCHHVIDEEYIKNNPFLYLSYYSSKGSEGTTEAIIDLNIHRIIYHDKNSDVTIIEIKEEDNLDIYSFLEMDNSINVNNPQILNHKVYLLHYPKGVEDVQFSQGRIIDLKDKINFTTNYWSEPGSSGSPIFDSENDLVIGIHRKGSKNKENYNEAIGIILKYAVEKFIKKKKEEIIQFYKNLYPQTDTMILIYIIQNNKEVHMLCEKFVKRNKEKCKIIYNGNIYPLTKNFPVSNITNEDKQKGEIKIILKGINYITDMSYMFSKCKDLKKVIATGTDMSKVKYMEATFEWCGNLEELSNTAKWNLENVETIKGLFYKCVNLKKVPGIGKWNLIKLKNCEEMFLGCQSKLNPSIILQVNNWKSVPENVKSKYLKGFGVNNILSYAVFENPGGTYNYFKKLIKIN